ncbi:YcaO-like family protein [Nonomuraea rubra]|uniref:YcaO-like family protein n=1 Tax=Nonomuraea rubra TaxID=46180 RepID=UPI0036081280
MAATRVIEHDPSIPRALTTVQADVADMGRRFPWATNVLCGASSFGDAAGARAAAIGESVERYCANWIQPELLRKASYAELRQAGENALAPESIVLFSEAQYAAEGFPFVRFDGDLPVHWIAGRSLTHDRPIWVPASLAYCNYYVGPYYHEPITNPLYYAGVAAGESFDDAVRSGLEEVIERDATMVWWANLPALPSLEPTPRLAALFDGTPGQRAWLIPLPNEFDVPVIAGVVEHARDQILTIGFGCRDTLELAAEKAWAEALTLQEIARDLQDPDGLYWEAVHAGRKARHFMHEWRADRAYLDSFRPDFRDVGDLECQMQVNLDPRAVERVRSWLDSGTTIPASSVSTMPDRSLSTYRQRVEQAGYEVIAVDLTTPDVAAAGLHVTRTLVPGLAGNFAAAFPYLGADRLRNAAVKLGWPARTELNVFLSPTRERNADDERRRRPQCRRLRTGMVGPLGGGVRRPARHPGRGRLPGRAGRRAGRAGARHRHRPARPPAARPRAGRDRRGQLPWMLEQLRAKPRGDEIDVVEGDFADVKVDGEFGLAFISRFALSALTTQEAQVQCFENVAAHLAPGGFFVVELMAPASGVLENGRAWASNVKPDAVSLFVSTANHVTQEMRTCHIRLSETEGVQLRPGAVRYIWPSELDLMARIAGMRLHERWSSWDKAPFTATSTRNISAYRKA